MAADAQRSAEVVRKRPDVEPGRSGHPEIRLALATRQQREPASHTAAVARQKRERDNRALFGEVDEPVHSRA